MRDFTTYRTEAGDTQVGDRIWLVWPSADTGWTSGTVVAIENLKVRACFEEFPWCGSFVVDYYRTDADMANLLLLS